MLRNLAEHLRQSGITLVLTDVKKHVQEVIERTGLVATLGGANLFATSAEAFESLRTRD